MPSAHDIIPANPNTFWLRLGRGLVASCQALLYRRILSTRIDGGHHVPTDGGFLIASNHSSHLDAGLIKTALGARGPQMRALAAQDYFFAQALSRWYFENLTNVLPFERNGGFRGSLKRATRIVEAGFPLLIFPEGTRSRDGQMAAFKPALSSLALAARAPIVPMYLWGTHQALPKGAGWLRARRIGARVGPPLSPALLQSLTANASRHEAYRICTRAVEVAIEHLRDGQPLEEQALVRVLLEEGVIADPKPHVAQRHAAARDNSPLVGIA